jgi:hypothetical protein
MKRDMDVIRRIVLALRDSDRAIESVDGLDLPTYNMHAALLVEAGLAEGNVNHYYENATNIPDQVGLYRLTWEGQDFADSIDDDTVWQKAKEHVIKPGASWSFAVLGEWLKAEARHRLGLPL